VATPAVGGGVWQPLLLVVVCVIPCVLIVVRGNPCVFKVLLITLVRDQHFYVSNLMWWESTDTGFMLYVNKHRFPFMQVYPPLGS